jgi:hypothetical protein
VDVDQQAGLRDVMTSESDSTSGRRPPTIELTATEVEQPKAPQAAAPAAEKVAKPDQSDRNTSAGGAATQPAAKSEGRLVAHAVSAVIGAIAATAVLVGLWLTGFILAHDVVTQATAPDAVVNRSSADISARLDKIERAIQAPIQPPHPETATVPPALNNRLTAVELQAKMLGDSVAALNRRADDIAAAAQTAQKQATGAAADAAKNAGQGGVQPADLDALTGRIAALEGAAKPLSEQVAHPTTSADRAARLTVAAQALRAAVERGAPYQADLKAVQQLGADQSATAPLEPFAATGVPHAEALAHDLAALLPALRQPADTSSGDTTFLGKLKANMQNLVEFTPAEPPPGNDPASVITRIDIDADRGDIDAALNDIAALPDRSKALSADWAKRAQARQAAIAASRTISADALAALSSPAAR